MEKSETSITKKEHIIPVHIRSLIGLVPYDKVRFEVDGNTVKISRAP